MWNADGASDLRFNTRLEILLVFSDAMKNKLHFSETDADAGSPCVATIK